MKYFKQEENYRCGNACFRMVLSQLGLEDVSESDLEVLMNTKWNSGTHYNDMIGVAEKFGLQCVHGENGTIEQIDQLTKDGRVVVLAYSVDVPHYAVYMENNGNHLFLHDPTFGEYHSYLISKFERKWLVDVSLYKVAMAEMYLKLDESLNTYHWFVAYKK